MNNTIKPGDDTGPLGQSLSNAPETGAKVSERLHQDIMRAVRLNQPRQKRTFLQRHTPVWVAGLAATAAVVVYLAQPPISEPVFIPAPPGDGSAMTALAAFEEKLAVLPTGTGLPEAELRKELERLKSDLQRFGIGS
jgi:hypothetical protein